MRARKEKVNFLLYPEDNIKENWDFFILVILIISCITTPYRIAFGDINEPLGWKMLNVTCDSLFFLDILVIFNSGFYDNNFHIVENRKIIAREYFKSWFLIDLLAILPFEDVMNAGMTYENNDQMI